MKRACFLFHHIRYKTNTVKISCIWFNKILKVGEIDGPTHDELGSVRLVGRHRFEF